MNNDEKAVNLVEAMLIAKTHTKSNATKLMP